MESSVPMRKFWEALAPATLAAISLILVIISISAGHSPGVMEDYHVLYFNTSTLGKSLLNNTDLLRIRSAPTMPIVTETPNLLHRYHATPDKRFGIDDLTSEAAGAANAATSEAGRAATAVTSAVPEVTSAASSLATEAASAVASAASAAQSGLEHLVGEAKQALEEVADDLADELYKKLGIQQFYSVHLTDMCYGNFTPSATTPGAGFGVDNCTQPLNWTQSLDFTGMLNHSLGVGPFQLDLADIGMVQDVVITIDNIMVVLNNCLEAILALYIIASIFIGLSTALSLWTVFALAWTPDPEQYTVTRRTKNIAHYGNLAAAYLATLFMFIGNMVTTIGGKYAVQQVREYGEEFGLTAYRGGKFLAMSWATFALVLVVALFWTVQCLSVFLERRRRTTSRGVSAREKAEDLERDDSFSYQAPRRREMPHHTPLEATFNL